MKGTVEDVASKTRKIIEFEQTANEFAKKFFQLLDTDVASTVTI